jgi:hypothetical protein
MKTISYAERIELYPQRDILGERMDAWCLCPSWVGWMPWLVDGVEVLQVVGKTIEKNRTSRHHLASLKGI